MFHPLAPNLSELSDDDLNSKYNELIKKLNQAHKFGPIGVIPQIQMLITHYQEELQRRHDKRIEEFEKQMSQKKGFKGIIDIQ